MTIPDILPGPAADADASIRALEQRLRELNCLYEVSSLMEKTYLPAEDVLDGVVRIFHDTWLDAGAACLRITLENAEYKSENFRKTPFKAGCDIVVNGRAAGLLELYSFGDLDPEAAADFAARSGALLAAAAGKLEKFIEHRRTEGALFKYHDELEILMTKANEELKREIEERKQAEEALRISDERYNLAIRASGVGVWEWNLKTDEIYLAPNLKEILGYADHEILNRMADWMELVHPADRRLVAEATLALKNRETSNYELEYRMLHKTGGVRWFLVRGTVISDEKQTPARVFGTHTDITDRKILEENWRTYEFIANASREFMTLIDNNYVYKAANTEYCKAHGLDLSEILGKTVESVWGSDKFQGLIKGYLDQCFEGKEVHYEAWFEFLGQKSKCYYVSYYPYANERGEYTHAVVVSHDITDRKRAEEKLRDSQQRLQAIFEAVQAGILIIEKENRTIVDANQAASDISGIPKERLIGSRCSRYFCPDDSEKCRFLRPGKITGHAEQEIHRDAGEKIAIQKTVVPITLDGKEHIIESFMDITRLKEAEEKRRALEVQLQQVQKTQAIGTLAGGIAHDFNNILTPILLNTQVALLDIPEESALRNQLDEVIRAGHRARDLVKQILAFSRHGEQELKPLQLAPILKEAMKLLRASLPATIEIRQTYAADAGVVLADPVQIHQVLMNLCTNAAFAMREKGGVLDIRLDGVRLDDDLLLRFPELKPGDYLRLTVKDAGHGMNRSVMERIFDPYYTTKGKGEGVGLGLAVVQGIVTSHGGAISVESAPGKGAAFHVLLPEAKGVQPMHAEEHYQYSGGTESILLIDDEKPVADSVRIMLERLGYTVTAETDARQAVRLFKQRPDAFDAVITDQTMPKMTGVELARKLLRIRPDLPVILCTGFSPVSESQSKEKGISEYIMKPIIMNEIAAAIRRALGAADAGKGR